MDMRFSRMPQQEGTSIVCRRAKGEKMKLEELKKEVELELENKKTYRGVCHDCGKQVEVSVVLNDDGQIEIAGGAVYKVTQQFGKKELFFKCDDCFIENKTLEHYKKTEVYSRAIGYLRPTNQWNKGKRAEFKMRKVFVNMKGK
jgi:ribonucleoside-triphosphate reductase